MGVVHSIVTFAWTSLCGQGKNRTQQKLEGAIGRLDSDSELSEGQDMLGDDEDDINLEEGKTAEPISEGDMMNKVAQRLEAVDRDLREDDAECERVGETTEMELNAAEAKGADSPHQPSRKGLLDEHDEDVALDLELSDDYNDEEGI